MRRLIALIACGLLLSGCLSINRAFVNSVDDAWKAIRPEYMNYVMADPDLDEQDKGSRLRTIREFDKMIQEAKQ